MASKYSIEIIDINGNTIADMSGRAKGRQVTISRNEADDIRWTVDLNDFEAYCQQAKLNAMDVLAVNNAEIRVKRLGTVLSAGEIVSVTPTIDGSQHTIEIMARGYLDLLNSRYLYSGVTFTATTLADMAWSLVNQTQSQPYGDLGIRRGIYPANAKPFNRDFNAFEASIRDYLQDMTKLADASIDIEVTWEKLLNITNTLGPERKDIVFEYPNNILSLSMPIDGTATANRIYALGAGIGDATIKVIKEDTVSQQNRKLREKILNLPGSENTDNSVSDAAQGELNTASNPVVLPTLTVDGNRAPFVTDYHIGDRIGIVANGYSMFSPLKGYYRLEKIALSVDDNDNEIVELTTAL